MLDGKRQDAEDFTLTEPAPEAPRYWFFTFGAAHAHPDGFVKIFGTHDQAREVMFRSFGEKWSRQYASAADAGVATWNLVEVVL